MALSLLIEHPEKPLSLSATARALKLTPMALYTYFGEKDSFHGAVTEALLTEFQFDPRKCRAPTNKIVAWAYAMREFLLARRGALKFISCNGGHLSISRLVSSAVVLEAVSQLGFSEEESCEISLWIFQVVFAATSLEAHVRFRPRMTISDDEVDGLHAELRNQVKSVRKFADRIAIDGRFFDYQIDRMKDALAALVKKTPASSSNY